MGGGGCQAEFITKIIDNFDKNGFQTLYFKEVILIEQSQLLFLFIASFIYCSLSIKCSPEPVTITTT